MLYHKSKQIKIVCIAVIILSLFFASLLGWQLVIKDRLNSNNIGGNYKKELANLANWRLIFDDEFNGKGLDIKKWNIEDKSLGGYRNCCLNYGAQHFTPDMLSIHNGSLQITTERQEINSSIYTSGAITTENKFSFLYGRIDIKAILPNKQGIWPALWLLPNGSKGIAHYEVDIVELLGNNSRTVFMTNHWGGKGRQIQGHYTGLDLSQKYHVFSLVWNRQAIVWYIDGYKYFQTSLGISNEPMYLIINSSLGGNWQNASLIPILPQYMNIDYVRVYQPISEKH